MNTYTATMIRPDGERVSMGTVSTKHPSVSAFMFAAADLRGMSPETDFTGFRLALEDKHGIEYTVDMMDPTVSVLVDLRQFIRDEQRAHAASGLFGDTKEVEA